MVERLDLRLDFDLLPIAFKVSTLCMQQVLS